MTTTFPDISSESVVEVYKRVSSILKGYEITIFSNMNKVDNRFIIPSDPNHFEQKHKEIQRILEFSDVINGIQTICCLFEEIWKEINSTVGMLNISRNTLLDSIKFQTSSSDVYLKLTDDLRWAITTNVYLGHKHTTEISLDLRDRNMNWSEIVPNYIIEYILSAINAYKQGMYSASAALLSIAVEGTLRDVLATKGYAFDVSAVNVDVYEYATAHISVSGNSYLLTYQEPLPKLTSDFHLLNANHFEIKVRRLINKRKSRTDFAVIGSPELLDYLSKDTKGQTAQKTVNGLGEALRIAREVEGFLTPLSLPLDFDDVITGVRNNLIHLSGQSLNQQLRILNITLKEFLNNEKMIYSLITRVPRFINDQYIQLKREGF